jgi:predicted nuclease with RNAse H fold
VGGARTTIIGIDAATQPKKVGLARGHLDRDTLVVTDAVLGSEVESVAETVASWIGDRPTLLAIDAPLGWPAPLAQGLHRHRAGQVLQGDGHDLFRGLTDMVVHDKLRKLPLEVGADRIARTAHAALRLLGEVRDRTGLDIPLAWSPEVEGVAAIEVYPAATLRCHNAAATSYKGKDDVARDYRETILSALRGNWTLQVDDRRLAGFDHLLDAAVCVLAGADFLWGKCGGPTADQQATAEVEGWVWFMDR